MSGLQERMRQRVTNEGQRTPARVNSGVGERRYPHRITLDLGENDYEVLRRSAFEQRLSMAHLLRALVQLRATDQRVAREVEVLAARLAAEDRRSP